jgi:pimeloyl-ACP methyl ester carboxylesterase
MYQSLPEPVSHTYSSNRLRLHYLDWGNHTAPTLLFLHGGRDHCRSWDWIAAQIRDRWHVVAPDLRGHGDNQWSQDGHYGMEGFIYDLSQLIDQRQLAPVTLVGHSLGGNICLRYAGIYPDKVRKLVAVEGLGPSPQAIAQESNTGIGNQMRTWIAEQHELARRIQHRYASFEEASARMSTQNKHLSREQAQHLTKHGIVQNADGTWSWKFDNYLRSMPPFDMTRAQIQELWSQITCPTLLVYGKESWASNPLEDGRARYFRNARVVTVENAGHWVQHDQMSGFIALLQEFL